MTDAHPGQTVAPGNAAMPDASTPDASLSDASPQFIPEITMRLFKLTNLISGPFRHFAKEHDITLNEWRVLVVLATHPGLAAQDISRFTGIHAMTISRAVAALRASGRLAESRDPDNHRRTLLWLTDRGRKTYEKVVPHSIAASQNLYSILSQEQIDTLMECLDLLIDRAEETLDR